jgi:predicted transcriptional regulator
VQHLLEGFPDNRLYIAKREDKVTEVFKGLIHFKFNAVPILRKKGNKYIGFLEIFDIVQYIVNHFGIEKLSKMTDFWKLVDEEYLFHKLTINDIMIHSKVRSPFVAVKVGYSLSFACELIGRESCRRVAIINEDKKLLSLITETQLLHFIEKHESQLGNILTKKVDNIKTREVFTILHTELAMRGFQEMVDKKVQGLAVVDEVGKLVGCLSLTDLKVISHDGRLFFRLFKPIKDFLGVLEADRPRKVITCGVDHTMKDVMKALSLNRIHQIYVVNDQHVPLGTITTSDFILEVISV